jgi:hypothetical protein
MNPREPMELEETRRRLLPTYHFTIHCLLYSRVESGLVSTPGGQDEDVNAYLAHLLHAFINPEFVEQSRKFLTRYDVDAFRRLIGSSDARLKYTIYRTSSDFLLLSVGFFDDPAPAGGPQRSRPSEEAYVGRGSTYYHFAYTYAQPITRKNAGVGEVLEKLSVAFDKYLRILAHMRGEPLDLAARLAQGEVYHLERTVNEAAMQQLLRTKQDELLELYSAWQASPDREIEQSLARLVEEIRQINPEFRFDLPKKG